MQLVVVESLRELLNQDVAVAKQWINEHVDAIVMTPAGEGRKRHYVASGKWKLLGRNGNC